MVFWNLLECVPVPGATRLPEDDLVLESAPRCARRADRIARLLYTYPVRRRPWLIHETRGPHWDFPNLEPVPRCTRRADRIARLLYTYPVRRSARLIHEAR